MRDVEGEPADTTKTTPATATTPGIAPDHPAASPAMALSSAGIRLMGWAWRNRQTHSRRAALASSPR